jgi:hypothetical protein
MKFLSRLFISAGVVLALCFGLASTTQLNLVLQIQGILPIANGGTGASTFAGANIDVTNVAQSITAAKTFNNSDIILLGSSTGGTTFTSANSSSTNYSATFPAVTNYVLEGDISSSGGTPRLQEQAWSTGSTLPAETTSSLLGIMYATKAITVRAAWVLTEVPASSCSTEPAYAVYYNTSVSKTSAVEISSSNCTAAATTLGATSCGITATSVASGDYVFWEVATAPVSCADHLRLSYEYTMN